MVFRCQVIIGSHIVPLIRAHLGVPWRIGEKEKAMEIDRLHEDEVLSLSWIRLTRGTVYLWCGYVS